MAVQTQGDIRPLLSSLSRLSLMTPVKEKAIVLEAISRSVDLCLKGQATPAQISALLTAMHFLELDCVPEVIVAVARVMRANLAPVPLDQLKATAADKSPRAAGAAGTAHHEPAVTATPTAATAVAGLAAGAYKGGFCDIVGTGGDKHNTFNISTTASIISSAYLLMAKHGNRASTSKSGSADVLQAFGAPLDAITPEVLPEIYRSSNYGFLFAPVFHPGMKHIGPIRKQLPWRTVFNLVGPLVNPMDQIIEARMIGVARTELGPLFAEVLKISSLGKTLVVCGEENLDEISCAGPTDCWMLTHVEENIGGGKVCAISVATFKVCPADFGLPVHPLSDVAPGGTPEENAKILGTIIRGEMAEDDPIMHFVLINAAALLVMSGCCQETTEEANARGIPGEVITESGPGGMRWKEGIRRARHAIRTGMVRKQWENFVNAASSKQ